MSIGDTLAEARRRAGLTVTQVSQRTRIRETIIRDIERDDFSACGGDFYARGHIRSIASAVGVDPEPLIAEYDATRTPHTIRAAEVFQPATPIKLKERRRSFNWSLALIVVLLAVIGYGAYRLVGASTTHGHGRAAAVTHPPTTPTPRGSHRSRGTASPSPSPTTSATVLSKDEVITLTVAAPCWIDLTDSSGATIYTGTLPAGTRKTWKETHPVSLRLGNPPGVTLTVNGKRQALHTTNPITLSIEPGGKVSVTSGVPAPSGSPAPAGSPSAPVGSPSP